MVQYIEIGGKKLPMRRSLGAFKKFDDRYKGTGVSTLTLGQAELSVEHMIALLWLVVEAGMKFEGKIDKNITEQWIEDNADMDDVNKFMQAFAESDDNAKKKTQETEVENP